MISRSLTSPSFALIYILLFDVSRVFRRKVIARDKYKMPNMTSNKMLSQVLLICGLKRSKKRYQPLVHTNKVDESWVACAVFIDDIIVTKPSTFQWPLIL